MGSRRVKSKGRRFHQQQAAPDRQRDNGTVVFSLPETMDPNQWLTDYDSLWFDETTAIGSHLLTVSCWRNCRGKMPSTAVLSRAAPTWRRPVIKAAV